MKNIKKLVEEVRFAELKKIKMYTDNKSNEQKKATYSKHQVA